MPVAAAMAAAPAPPNAFIMSRRVRSIWLRVENLSLIWRSFPPWRLVVLDAEIRPAVHCRSCDMIYDILGLPTKLARDHRARTQQRRCKSNPLIYNGFGQGNGILNRRLACRIED